MPDKNCHRCGNQFAAALKERVCVGCRIVQEDKPVSKRITLRDRQLVEMVIEGKFNKEIAYELHLTEATIKTYMSRVFWKTGVSNRTELAVKALRHQLEALEVTA